MAAAYFSPLHRWRGDVTSATLLPPIGLPVLIIFVKRDLHHQRVVDTLYRR